MSASGTDGRAEAGGPPPTAAQVRLGPSVPDRLDLEREDMERGLAQLVLTVIELLRQVLEQQAVRRMEGGSLDDHEVERLGLAFMRLRERMDTLKTTFGLEDEDLRLDLGPLSRLL